MLVLSPNPHSVFKLIYSGFPTQSLQAFLIFSMFVTRQHGSSRMMVAAEIGSKKILISVSSNDEVTRAFNIHA